MGRDIRARRGARTATALVAALTAAGVLATGCSRSDRPDAADRSPTAPTPTAPPSPLVSPEPSPPPSTPTAPVLAVKIDNAPAARPHTGTDAADVVYVEQVEGGLSRLMAVYATRLPETVGPVRSARESDLEILRQFHDPVLAYSGAQSKLKPLIDAAPVDARPPERAGGAYYRGHGRAAPHNLYLRPGRLAPEPPGPEALTTGFTYGAAPSGGRKDTSETVRYPAASFTFTWSGARERYLVSMDGAPAVTAAGQRVAAATVVVQYVTIRPSRFHDFLGNNTPYTETVGSGRAKVLRGGRAYDAAWERPSAASGTTFTTRLGGEPLNFAKGPVWVVFAKAP